jgi:NADP-dependent 3-hydroxy acid dehydrogenase YdfG
VDKKEFGPWAIVTGASCGISEEFARQLAASGMSELGARLTKAIQRPIQVHCLGSIAKKNFIARIHGETSKNQFSMS